MESAGHDKKPPSLHSPPVHVSRVAEDRCAAVSGSHLLHRLSLGQLNGQRRVVDRVGVHTQTLTAAQLAIVVATPRIDLSVLGAHHAACVATDDLR